MANIYNMSDVFISYSRRDEVFVRRLFADLKAQDKEVWADFEDIPKAADWWEEIKAGINAADTFVFVISPDSVQSAVCRDEIEHAVNANKRFVPILHREVTDPQDRELVHPAVNSHNWIFFRDSDDYDEAFKTLITAVDTDLDHHRTATRLLVRAQEWRSNNHGGSYLLHGEDLTDAETWLQAAVSKKPAPTDLHGEYINASRKAESARQRRLLTVVSIGLVFAIALSIFAVLQAIDARQARDLAEEARILAEQEAVRSQSLALASSAAGALFNNDPDLALVLAIEASTLDASSPQVFAALADAIYSDGTQKVLKVGNEFIYALAVAEGTDTIAYGTGSGRLCLYDVVQDAQITCLDGHDSRVTRLIFTPDNQRLLSTDNRGNLLWWDVDPTSDQYGEILAQTVHLGSDGTPNFIPTAVIAPPDGDNWRVYFGGTDGRFGVWSPTVDETPSYWDSPHTSPLQAMAITRNGTRLLTGDQDGLLVHWYVPDETYFETYHDLDVSISSIAFNTHGQEALVGYFDGWILFYDLVLKSVVNAYNAHEDSIRALIFGENDETFISTSWDRAIYEWDVASERIIRQFHGHRGGINVLVADPTTQRMFTAGFDTDVRVWSLDSFRERQLTNGTGIWHLEISPDGETLITSHENGDVILWDWRNKAIRSNFKGYGQSAIWATFSPDGAYVATIFRDHFLTLRDVESGKRLWTSELTELVGSITRPYQVHFTHDGERVVVVLPNILYIADATTGEEIDRWDFGRQLLLSARILPGDEQILLGLNRNSENLILYDLNTGEEIRQFTGHRDGVLTIALSNDAQYVATAGFDNVVRVWELATGAPIRAFNGHNNSINEVAFNEDGSVVASVSSDRTVRLWSLESGFEFFRYVGHAERLNSLSYTPSFDRFITGAMDGTFNIWELPQTLDGLLTWVNQNRYVRDLSCSEAILYLDSDCDPLAESG